jgi:hypothetical protein
MGGINSGFFAGGMADSMASIRKQEGEAALKNRELDITDSYHKADVGLRGRAMDIAERAGKRADSTAIITQVEKNISDTMGIVSETIKGGISAGRDPEQIQAAVAPLVASAKGLGARIGKKPEMFDAMVNAQLFAPTPTEAGTAAGTTKGAAAVAEGNAKTAGGFNPNAIDDPVKKLEGENKLRDDYLKQAAPYITIRDSKNRLDNIERTGAGDVALLFQFMKILDPGSTVREGEFETAGSVAGVPGQIEALRQKVIGGGRLSEDARKQIISQSNKIYQAAANQHDKLQTQFAGIAKRSGLNPDNVTINLLPAGAAAAGTTPGGTTFRIIQ